VYNLEKDKLKLPSSLADGEPASAATPTVNVPPKDILEVAVSSTNLAITSCMSGKLVMSVAPDNVNATRILLLVEVNDRVV